MTDDENRTTALLDRFVTPFRDDEDASAPDESPAPDEDPDREEGRPEAASLFRLR